MKKIFFLLIFSSFSVARIADTLASQSHIQDKYESIKNKQEIISLRVKFNNGVLFLKQKKYLQAIALFKESAKILEVPSFLNIGIAYYKLKNYKNAKLFFNEILKHEKIKDIDLYGYLSANYYMYKITKDIMYLDRIISLANGKKKISEYAKRLLLDTYILEKDYKRALRVLDKLQHPSFLKKALLYIKLKNYKEAFLYLQKAEGQTKNPKVLDDILWFNIYLDILTNNMRKLNDDLDKLQERKKFFKSNLRLPINIFFDKYKYSPSFYFKKLLKFDKDFKIDYIFYFAPFVFSDNEEIFYDATRGFVFADKQGIDSVTKMVIYNRLFLEYIKMDPIIRIKKLKELLKTSKKAYTYYNIGLSYAQIYDFYNAYKYFRKAYKLNPGNKLYMVMVLLSAKRVHIEVKDSDYIKANIQAKDGIYKYFGLKIYKTIIDTTSKKKLRRPPKFYRKMIFYKALEMLSNMPRKGVDLNSRLLKEESKDPLVYLMRLVAIRKGENRFSYVKRIQDTTPLDFNSTFLTSSLVVANYYLNILKATRLIDKANFLVSKLTPSYLLVKSIYDIHTNKPSIAIKTLEYLSIKYKLNNPWVIYLMISAYLEKKDYSMASLYIEDIKLRLKDKNAEFLSAIQLLQELKIRTAKKYFGYPYNNEFINFKLDNFDKYLESL